MSQPRPQISIENLIHIQKITGRSSYAFDASLTEVLEKFRKYENFYNHHVSEEK